VRRLILASASPRRQALLRALGLQFEVITSAADEHFLGSPPEMVVSNARNKRDDVATRLDAPAVVLGADTLVFLGDQVLGKPADLDQARAMLRRLAGKTHDVLTGLSLLDTATGRSVEGYERTGVTFRPLSDAEIAAFVDAVRPLDRAGAYTVDGPGSLLVSGYLGCFYNVLGLPLVRLDLLLRGLDLSLFHLMDPRQAVFL